MKRSKTLLAANVLSTLYVGYLLITYIGLVVKAGGMELLEFIGDYFAVLFEVMGTDSVGANLVTAILVLLCVHVVLFTLGWLLGWIAYARKKSGGAKFAATLYLIGTICFPVYFIFGLPITIVGFIGGGKQKKINQSAEKV